MSQSRLIAMSENLHSVVVSKRLTHPDQAELNRHIADAVGRQTPRGWLLDKSTDSAQIDSRGAGRCRLACRPAAASAGPAARLAPVQRPCLDCGALIAEGSRCPSCSWKRKAAASPERMRGRRWMRRRAAVMRRAGGMCERCGERLAEEVHHMGELSDNRMESLVALCAPCHSQAEVEKQAKGTR